MLSIKKTEAGAREIKKESNIQRIRNYIESNEKLNYIIMFGKKSDSLYKVLQEFISLKNTTIKLIKDIPHLGYQSLNRISEDVDDDTINEEHYDSSKARTEARLKVVAKRIIEQI